MKRILVVDDERPIVEGIALIVRRDLGGEFEIVGSASSGREAIEKAATLMPDIVLMDVRMPGISGLDAIREIKKRGFASAFILVTAYERFQIAREAVELGVLDYLLKPVAKDKLALSLRAAADFIDRRGELEQRDIESREREERMRVFVEAAFLHGVMLGERFGPDLDRYCAALGIQDPLAVVAVAAFLPPHGSPNPDAEAEVLHEKFRATVRYKTRALAGPLVTGHSLVLLPLKDEDEVEGAMETLRSVISQTHASEIARGYLRLGFGTAKPLANACASWSEAMGDLLGSRRSADSDRLVATDKPFEDDESFLEGLVGGSPDRARLALERLMEPLCAMPEPPLAGKYHLISLFGAAYRILSRRGLLESPDAFAMMDFEDLRTAGSASALNFAVRARFSKLVDVMTRKPHWSPTVARAIAFVKENYGRQMSLEFAAYSVGISPNRLSRLFSEETGKGFSDFLIEFRIEKAKALLSMPGASIKQVSMSCGYPDPNYFSRLFKKVTGLTPTAFSSGAVEAIDGRP